MDNFEGFVLAVFIKARDKYSISVFSGDGLIASNGDKWFRMRRLLTSAFHFEILRSYVQVFQDSTNVLLVSKT